MGFWSQATAPADTPSSVGSSNDAWLYEDFASGLDDIPQRGVFTGKTIGMNAGVQEEMRADPRYEEYLQTGKDVDEPDPQSASKWQEVSALPTKFNSVEEMLAYTGKGNSYDLNTNGFSAKGVAVFEHVNMLPKDVQEQIAADPRRFAAGQLGLLDRSGAAAQSGYQWAQGAYTPSGRWLSFEDKWGGYDPSFAKTAKWDKDNGLMISDQAVFVPHKDKYTLLSKVAPALIIGAATAGVGSGFGAAIGSSIVGQAAAGAASAAAQGGSGKDIALSALAGGIGAGVGGAVSGSSAVTGAVGQTGAKIIGSTAGALAAGAVGAVGGNGSWESALTRGFAAGIGGAVGAYTGSPVAGSVTSGLINAAGQAANIPNVTTSEREVLTPAPSVPTPVGGFSGGLSWGWLTKDKQNGE